VSDWLHPELAQALDAMTDAQVVSLILAGEARSEPVEGIVGVANTIRNRVKADTWFGKTFREVCLKPKQFSCLFEAGGRANFKRVLALAKQFASKTEITDPRIKQCVGVATLLMADGYLTDNTHNSTHYVVYTLSPEWAKGHKPAVRLGAHHFYNTVK
jgi:spore germination cell wall hydrolase CwlJ-like protein